ncbi:MAG TPA: hypothetical protein VK787_16165 [Puia sp.]|jgi:hypothetical protein|nr:hypothetical protein [Puia sp.]
MFTGRRPAKAQRRSWSPDQPQFSIYFPADDALVHTLFSEDISAGIFLCTDLHYYY